MDLTFVCHASVSWSASESPEARMGKLDIVTSTMMQANICMCLGVMHFHRQHCGAMCSVLP